MKIRLTDNTNNIYTIFNNKEVAIGEISQDVTGLWVASVNGEIVATGSFTYIIHTLTA